ERPAPGRAAAGRARAGEEAGGGAGGPGRVAAAAPARRGPPATRRHSGGRDAGPQLRRVPDPREPPARAAGGTPAAGTAGGRLRPVGEPAGAPHRLRSAPAGHGPTRLAQWSSAVTPPKRWMIRGAYRAAACATPCTD